MYSKDPTPYPLWKITWSNYLVLSLISIPLLLAVLLQADLKIVAAHRIPSQDWLAWVFDVDSIVVIQNRVGINYCLGLAEKSHAAAVVVFDAVVGYRAQRVEENDAVLVVHDHVCVDFEAFASFDHENAFLFAALDSIELDLGVFAVVAAQRYVCLYVLGEVVSYYHGCAALFEQDALAVVLVDDVASFVYGVGVADYI